jgi:propanediol dehydratase small subunit
MQTIFVLLLLVVIVGVAIPVEIVHRRSFAPYANRKSDIQYWHVQFPHVREAEICKFLTKFVDAFSLNNKHRFKFRPEDRLLDIYRAINPPKWTLGDALEFELFSLQLERQYGLRLEGIWREDLTLGDVFGKTRV